MKLLKCNLYLSIICTVVITVFSSCGESAVFDEFDFSRFSDKEQVLTVAIIAPHDLLFPRDTIQMIFNNAFNKLRSQLWDKGISITFVTQHIHHDTNRIEEHFIRLRTQLMAGEGADLIMVLGHPIYEYARQGFLTDIYELIYLDPNVSLEDFYQNVLQAFEFDGRLIAMPMLYSVQLIGINSTLPESIIERFASLSQITIREMMEIFNDLQNYEGYSHLAFSSMMHMHNKIQYELSHHVNLAQNLLDMDIVAFASYLELAKPALSASFGYGIHIPYKITDIFVDLVAFSNKFIGRNLAQALMDIDYSNFLHHIPLVTEDGRMMLASTSWTQLGMNPSLFAIREGNNRVLAWELLKLLMYEYANVDSYIFGLNSMETPIIRQLFYDRIREQLNESMNPQTNSLSHRGQRHSPLRFAARSDELRELEAINEAIERLAKYNEMSMAIPLLIPYNLFYETILHFTQGLITSTTAAQQIHTRLWLWMHE